MRIAIYHNLPSGGAKRALLEWVKRLARDHSIDIFTLSEADHDFCDLHPYVNDHRVFPYSTRRLFNSPFGRLNQWQRWRDLGTMEDVAQEIANVINGRDYDVLFANSCQRTIIPSLIPFVRIPVIYYFHDLVEAGAPRATTSVTSNSNSWRGRVDSVDPLIPLYQRRLAAIRQKGVMHSERLLTNSHFIQTRVRQSFGLDSYVVHLGVDLTDFRLLSSVDKRNHVLSVGEMTPRKGFGFLIESLAMITEQKRPTLRLVSNWIDPAERGYLEELASQKHVFLEILPRLNTDALAVEYNRARLCVYSPVAEPLGLVPLESMACGTPVVGVAEAGVLETIRDGETGILVPRDPMAFAAAVEELYENETLYQKLSKQARPYIEAEWSWDKSARQLEMHFQEVVNSVSLSTTSSARTVSSVSGHNISPFSQGETV